MLDRLYIGELDVAPGEEMEVVEYEDDLAEGQFYQVLKRRVEKYFRGNEVQSRGPLCRAAFCSTPCTACLSATCYCLQQYNMFTIVPVLEAHATWLP